MTKLMSRFLLALACSALAVFVSSGGSGKTASASTAANARARQDQACYYTPSTTGFLLSANGFTDLQFTVTANCDWMASTTVNWILVDGRRQELTATAKFSVTANTGDRREGSIQILAAEGDSLVATISVSQDSACHFEFNPAGGNFRAPGGFGSFDVTLDPASGQGCAGRTISPTTSAAWVHISPPSGSRIGYTVDPNTGPARSAGITVNPVFVSDSFSIGQDAANGCAASSFSFSPSSETFDRDGTFGFAGQKTAVDVKAPANCGKWTPVSTVGWITLDTPGKLYGPGSDTVLYRVQTNTGNWRSGFIVVGGQTFSVYQNPGADCPINLLCAVFPLACAGSAGIISVSHSFKDKVLAKSIRGQQYTRLYYQFSREAVSLMLSNPMLLLRSRDMITRYKPVLESILKGDPVNLTRGDLDGIDEFLSDFSEKGSPELKQALGSLKEDLRDPAVHAEFNISVVEGATRETAAMSLSHGLKGFACPWILVGAWGLILARSARKSRVRLARLGKRSLLILLPGALVAWSAQPLSARISGKTNPSAMNPALSYLTYLGGIGDDQGMAIATDSAGNSYLAGFTSSPNFPTLGAFQSALGGGQQDAFVCKLNSSGKLIYSTYVGGTGQDNATAIAVDSAGNAYVAGFTSSANFPVKNAVQSSLKGSVNAFVAKLDPAGSLVYSTYLGGSLSDVASGIAVDSAGNAYVSGVVVSADFPVASAAQSSIGGASNAFVAKLSPDGSRLIYSTYLGGRDTDGASGIAVDSAGQAYVTGVTSSRNFPTVNALRSSHGGGFFDAFVAKLNAAGNQLLYSTYLGGTGEDRGLRIAVDADGHAYVTGDTDSTDFPTVNPLQPTNKGASDAFVAKLNETGSVLVYSTYLGGSGLDGGTGIAVDPIGTAYVTGFTASTDFPLAAPLQQAYGGGAFDAFVTVLNPSGSATLISSYLGGSGIDSGFGIAADPKGGLCVMGQTNSRDLPVSNALQSSYGGDPSDVFVGKIAIGPVITGAQVSGKKLLVSGIGFDDGAKVLLNGDPQKTANDDQHPASTLVARKAGKLIQSGQSVNLQVQDSDGRLSPEFRFTRQ